VKILPLALLIAGCTLPVSAQERAPARITFNVQDDFGKPIPGATIAMGTFHHSEPGEGFGTAIYETFTGVTNAAGSVTISGSSLSGEFAYGPREKAGYYRGGSGVMQFTEKEDGRWEPWNPTVSITMKRVLNPIPMYARKMGYAVPLTIPAVDQPIGFDLETADWVAPFGNGKISDFIFTFTEVVPFVNAQEPFDVRLTVSFSNKGDGIQSVLVPVNEGSELQLPREAPEAGYESTLAKQIGRSAKQQPLITNVKDDKNYFFRVRTVTDQSGEIKSALYGKIYGDMNVWGNRRVRFEYYLNPNPNDRNMEFDRSKNMFGRLPPLLQVSAP
jgi:hypothetical protein